MNVLKKQVKREKIRLAEKQAEVFDTKCKQCIAKTSEKITEYHKCCAICGVNKHLLKIGSLYDAYAHKERELRRNEKRKKTNS